MGSPEQMPNNAVLRSSARRTKSCPPSFNYCSCIRHQRIRRIGPGPQPYLIPSTQPDPKPAFRSTKPPSSPIAIPQPATIQTEKQELLEKQELSFFAEESGWRMFTRLRQRGIMVEIPSKDAAESEFAGSKIVLRQLDHILGDADFDAWGLKWEDG